MNTLPASPDDLFEDDLGDSSNAVNPLMLVHRALRGRYVLAIALGMVLAVPLGAAGFIAMPPEYTSQAVLEANMTLPKFMYENDLNESMPAFEAFVSQQAATLQGERVKNLALESQELKARGWPESIEGKIKLNESMEVTTPRGQNMILLSVTDTDATTARVAAKSVLDAYRKIVVEEEAKRFGDRLAMLKNLQITYRNERTDLQSRALALSLANIGAEDISLKLRTKQEERERIDATIDDLQRKKRDLAEVNGTDDGDSMNGVESHATDPADPKAPSDTIVDPKQYEGEDGKLDRMIEERELIQRQLDALLLNATPAHRQAKRLSREIKVLDSEIGSRVLELNEIAASPKASIDGWDLTKIESQLEYLESRSKKAKDDFDEISTLRIKLFGMQQEIELANTRFEEVGQRIESLTVEKDANEKGRIVIPENSSQPLQPSTDRRPALAGAGLVGGFGTGVALVTAFGLAFPRVRVADDVTAGRGDFAMLGMIPVFPEEGDGEAALNVRESFHFLRVILDARRGQGGLVCGVTSPTSGDGKTTIALRLAQSYAAARRRVLLVDADLVGRGATRSMGLSDSMGLDGENDTLDQVVHTLDDLGFDMIPASNAEHASEIFCGHTLQRILREAKDRYDIVLVDTGPILGSIEAAAIAPSMDQILLVISRGLESRLLRMATDRLRELGARSVGIIFNKATTVDFNRSFAPPSSTSRRSVQRGVTTANLAQTRETMMSSGDQDTDR